MAAQLCEQHTNNHWIVNFKGVNFIVSDEVYLTKKKRFGCLKQKGVPDNTVGLKNKLSNDI